MIDKINMSPLAPEHLDQVLKIEQVSFPTPWSRQAFLCELKQNTLAYYYVGLLDQQVIGYAGMWVIVDEAHITNIAVHPDFRGQKVGELLLLHLMSKALERGAYKMTLEVRPSNLRAQRLYLRMGFETKGRRKGYYTDTNEDALIMWKTLITG